MSSHAPEGFEAYAAAERAAVEQALAQALDIGGNPTLRAAMRHYPLAEGKRLRPLTALTVARALGGEAAAQRTLPFAVALELIHNFTLVHDDIMDQDLVRKGLPAVHARWDVATAINAGDAMHARAFELLAGLEVPTEGLRTLVRETAAMVRQIGEGQQFDMEFERRRDVTEQEYLTMVEYKTALMYRSAARGGAILAGASSAQVEAMTAWGTAVGIGFQIRDDVLNLTADPSRFRKGIGADLRSAKQTLIAIAARTRLSAPQRVRFDRAYGNADASAEEVADAIAALQECGAIVSAQGRASQCVADAHRLLQPLPQSRYREYLVHLIHLFVERPY